MNFTIPLSALGHPDATFTSHDTVMLRFGEVLLVVTREGANREEYVSEKEAHTAFVGGVERSLA